ncbi:MAG: cellulose biosynthesis protein BcsS [Pseudolabrys sp.]
MSCGRRVRAVAVAAAALGVCAWCLSAGPSWAAEEKDTRLILFSGQDFWRNGAFLYGGLIWAPRGVDRDGLLLKVLLAGGQYRYVAGDLGGASVTGTEGLAAVMPGWRIKRGPVEVKVFFGPEFQQHRLSPDDPGNQLRGGSLGLRFATEVWAEPTPATMIAADASLSSIGGNNSARAAFGWKAFDRFYIGPETQIYAGDGYKQTRFGAHITSLKIGATEWSAAGGWARDTDNRSGAYLRINVLTRR